VDRSSFLCLPNVIFLIFVDVRICVITTEHLLLIFAFNVLLNHFLDGLVLLFLFCDDNSVNLDWLQLSWLVFISQVNT
jgi:hypothetical protein